MYEGFTDERPAMNGTMNEKTGNNGNGHIHSAQKSATDPPSIKQRHLYKADESMPWPLTFLFGLQVTF
jgi:hypothetical protein